MFVFVDFSSEVNKVNRLSVESFFLKSSSGTIKIQLHHVMIDRGMSWDAAYNSWTQCKTQMEGFYMINSVSIANIKFNIKLLNMLIKYLLF